MNPATVTAGQSY
ncbi:hypothetical protein E2C01_097820 [Portunus trituberculatus]|uniref:Uncharacterized protein n=4 Tax=Portunus trituberculatus TaxID=210409 RepID=A0A5B7KB27_PORTR|nr:hypothetical protein [Portunus trituberculatus]